jgi:serpin B
MKSRIWSKLILVVLVFALFSADALAKGVSLMLKKSSFVAGDRMEVKCEANATDISAQSADVYFALGTPDATLYCMDTDGLLGDPNVISAALPDWPVVDIASATLFAIDLPAGIPSGTYAWYLVLCEPGKDVINIDNWLADDAYQWVFTDGNGTGMKILRSEQQRNSAPDVPEAELTELGAGNSNFAFDLYKKVREGAGNLFYSPYSISLALAMTYAGAQNETESQMADTLHFSLTQAHLHPAFNALDLELASRGQGAEGQDGEGFRLNIVNSIWGQTDYSFLLEFLDVLAENYGAGLRLLDFQNAPEDSRVCINNWVSDQTEDRINDLIPQGSITPLTRLVLTNAIYFNAAWFYPFDEKDTQQDGTFHLLGDTQITVPMMSQIECFGYASGDGYQAVELPYDGEELSMVVFLPEADRFNDFETSLDAGQVEEIINNLSLTYLHLTMPKFEYKFSLGLKDMLEAMGMNDAFNPEVADFSGMDGKRDLYIGDVIHKAFVSVNEAGTEAAAATAVIMIGTGMPPAPIELTLDHPFIFLIRDIETGAILFVGRVLDPGQ